MITLCLFDTGPELIDVPEAHPLTRKLQFNRPKGTSEVVELQLVEVLRYGPRRAPLYVFEQ